MTSFENTSDILSQDNFSEFDFHSQFNPENDNHNISNSVLFEIMSITTPLDEANPSSNNQLLFISRKIMNRGRKINDKKLKRKTHTSNFIDNILCKLQIHFLNFLVNFSNDAIKTISLKEQNNNKDNKTLKFKKIEHGIKRNIKADSLLTLMQNSISYVLKQKISNKYWKLSKNTDYNEQIYNQVSKSSEWLKNMFDMNDLELFEKYYNQCNPFDNINFEGRIINFLK